MKQLKNILKQYKIITMNYGYHIAYKYPWQKKWTIMDYYDPYKDFVDAQNDIKRYYKIW